MITIGSDKGGRIDRPYENDAQITISSGRDYDGIIRGLESIKEKYDTAVMEKAQAYGRAGVDAGDFDTDEDLMARASNELDGKYAPKRTKAQQTYLSTLDSAGSEKSGLGASYVEDVRAIREKEAKTLLSQAERNARRGMTNSSVAKFEGDAARADAARQIEITDAYYAGRVNALDEKMRRAKQTYDDAMRGYDISYALELEKKMDKYRAERDKLIAAYEKSVNKEAEKRASEYLKENAALNAAYEAENGDYAGEKRENYRERYEYVRSAMQEMTDAEKKRFLAAYGSVLQSHLGLYYRKLESV